MAYKDALAKRTYFRNYQRSRRADPQYRLQERLKAYGLTVTDYERELAKQDGLCALCRKPPVAREFVVDHDHETGEFRGLVHFSCNTLLGWLESHAHLVEAAQTYLASR